VVLLLGEEIELGHERLHEVLDLLLAVFELLLLNDYVGVAALQSKGVVTLTSGFTTGSPW